MLQWLLSSMEEIFFEITLVICIAACLSIVFRFFKQPAILAYILTGVILGPLGIIKIGSGEVLNSLGQIGITLLLFMLGLEFKFSELKSVGRVALMTGAGQILFTTVVGYFICISLGFESLTSVYMAIALTFSSTIIIVKLLSDKKDLHSLYGKIAVAILLVQDFVAILALIFLSGFQGGEEISFVSFVVIILKAVALFGWVIVLSNTLIPKIVNKIARSSEVLFLFSIAWAFGISALVTSPHIGFTIEIGGFLAGLSLASTAENFHIVTRIRALRDFFITIFFVSLGMSLLFNNIGGIWLPAILLALYVLIGNPIILTSLLGFFGYRKRTSFLVGLTVAQISEFSMIVVFMGNKLGHVSNDAVSVITLAGTITFIISTYMIMNGNRLYRVLSPVLSIFERGKTHEQRVKQENLSDHVIMVGASRMGESILEALLKNDSKVVVVDFDPEVVKKMKNMGVNCVFGDIADYELQEKVFLNKSRLVVSTVPDHEDNLLLLESMRRMRRRPIFIVIALVKEDARELYRAGADYVVLPHLAGGRHLARILVDKRHMELIEEYKIRDREVILKED